MARELLWREYPTDQRGSSFRQFWDVRAVLPTPGETRTTSAASGCATSRRSTRWTQASDLGEHDHREAGGTRGRARPGDPRRAAEEVPDRRRSTRTGPSWQPTTDGDDRPDRRNAGSSTLTAAEEADPPPDQGPDAAVRGEGRARHLLLRLRPHRGGGAGRHGRSPTDDPGWFFVIKERPGEPRFGLDIERDGAARGLERPRPGRTCCPAPGAHRPRRTRARLRADPTGRREATSSRGRPTWTQLNSADSPTSCSRRPCWSPCTRGRCCRADTSRRLERPSASDARRRAARGPSSERSTPATARAPSATRAVRPLAEADARISRAGRRWHARPSRRRQRHELRRSPIATEADPRSAIAQLTTFPVLLGPVRLETRFTPTELLVRVFPDDWSVDTFEPARPHELEHARRYWPRSGRPAATSRRTARRLARPGRHVGHGRAALAGCSTRRPRNPGDEPPRHPPDGRPGGRQRRRRCRRPTARRRSPTGGGLAGRRRRGQAAAADAALNAPSAPTRAAGSAPGGRSSLDARPRRRRPADAGGRRLPRPARPAASDTRPRRGRRPPGLGCCRTGSRCSATPAASRCST